MDKKQLNGKDLLLSILYSPGQKAEINESIIGRTKLTKIIFLFEKEIYNQFFKDEIDIKLPEFKPYYFGPFSEELISDLSFFLAIGMIKTTITTIPLSPIDDVENEAICDYNENDEWMEASLNQIEKFELEYSLTSCGLKYVEDKIWGLFTSHQIEKLKSFKSQINKLSLDSLLRYVYIKYPEETKESLIAKKYLKFEE
ncbi:MAG: hypothetical protein Q8876_06790 [Bacillota bacterium]|nr:hypothetical protein [Bacillota bacterium]